MVDVFDEFRLRDVEKIVVSLQVRRMILELSPVCGFIELERLDHRPHRTIQDKDPAPKGWVDFVCYVSDLPHASKLFYTTGVEFRA